MSEDTTLPVGYHPTCTSLINYSTFLRAVTTLRIMENVQLCHELNCRSFTILNDSYCIMFLLSATSFICWNRLQRAGEKRVLSWVQNSILMSRVSLHSGF